MLGGAGSHPSTVLQSTCSKVKESLMPLKVVAELVLRWVSWCPFFLNSVFRVIRESLHNPSSAQRAMGFA